MTLYLDTEFNGFGGELISLALVSNFGAEFYAVVPLPSKVHPWVAEHVVPFLVKSEEPYVTMRFRLKSFLDRHKDETIIADWPEDFVHLLNCLCEPNGVMFKVELNMQLVNSAGLKPEIPHNALSDARALMYWHKANR